MKCIYAIINLKNGKMYIGSTTNLSRRRKAHLYLLKLNQHHSLSLQSSYNKNEISNYSFIILEKLNFETNMYEREQYYMDLYKTYNKENGYNMSKTALNPCNSNPELKVYQYDFNGTFINTYENCVKAADSVGCCGSGISSCCRERYRYYKGFVWFYKKDINDENVLRRINIAVNPLVFTDKRKRKISESGKLRKDNKKAIIQYDLNMNFIKEWKSTLEINQILGFSTGHICDCVGGRLKTAKGFIWKYKNIEDEIKRKNKRNY